MTITSFDANIHHMPDEHLSIETLAHFTTGIQQLTAAELEQLVDHIVDCQDCRKSMETVIAIYKDTDQTTNSSEIIISDLLARLMQIICEIDMQNDLSTYIEVLATQGEAAAERQFPLLAKHLKQCKACQSSLEETLILLHRAEEAGLIAPLS